MTDKQSIDDVAHDLYFKMAGIRGVARMLVEHGHMTNADAPNECLDGVRAIYELACEAVGTFEKNV